MAPWLLPLLQILFSLARFRSQEESVQISVICGRAITSITPVLVAARQRLALPEMAFGIRMAGVAAPILFEPLLAKPSRSLATDRLPANPQMPLTTLRPTSLCPSVSLHEGAELAACRDWSSRH